MTAAPAPKPFYESIGTFSANFRIDQTRIDSVGSYRRCGANPSIELQGKKDIGQFGLFVRPQSAVMMAGLFNYTSSGQAWLNFQDEKIRKDFLAEALDLLLASRS